MIWWAVYLRHVAVCFARCFYGSRAEYEVAKDRLVAHRDTGPGWL